MSRFKLFSAAMTLASSCVLASSYISSGYGFSDYHFSDSSRPWHIEGRCRGIGKANFKDLNLYGSEHYIDSNSALFYSQSINEDNFLIYELGYDFLGFYWDKNILFDHSQFHYMNGSLGYLSTFLDRWKWIVQFGFSVDAEHFNFNTTGVGHGMLWGQYQFLPNCAFHVGLFGWYGVMNGRACPIFGFDWQLNHRWSARAMYPADFAISYAFTDYWILEAAYAVFGGPYRYPRRVSSKPQDPIFELFSNGVELNLKFQFEHLLRASVGLGWDFGGWILLKDQKKHSRQYYHYGQSIYGQGEFSFTF